MRRQSAASQTAIERRAREDAAKRLREVVPELNELKLVIEEHLEGRDEVDIRHVRYIVIDRAPAIFEVGCSDRKCTGNHDLTRVVLQALSAHELAFDGKDACVGEAKDGACSRELHFRAEAQYAAAS